MRRRLSIRSRVAAWCAVLAVTTGALGVIVTLAITDARLRSAARDAPVRVGNPAGDPLGLGPAGAPAGRAQPGVESRLVTPLGRVAEGQRVAKVLDESRGRGLLTVVALAAASVVASWFAAARMLRPVQTMTRTAQRVAAPGSGERIRLNGPNDELRELADTIDRMLDRLDMAFDAQRRFVADASHELRTPLAVLTTEVDVALDLNADDLPALQGSLSRVRSELKRTSRLVDSLLHLSRAETIVHRETHDLAESAEQALAAAPRLGLGRRRVVSTLRSAPVAGDPVLLDRLVLNLVENAFRYNVDGGLVQVTTDGEATGAVIIIQNDGPVLADADVVVLFDRFRRGGDATARGRSDGHGLGLSIARAVVTTHGGTIVAEPRAVGGLCITVRLPG